MLYKITAVCAAVCLLGSSLCCDSARMLTPTGNASGNGFKQANLVADVGGTAQHTDPGFLNPWGVAFEPGKPFLVADNIRGAAKVFDPSGAPALPLVIGIPLPSQDNPPSRPTGIVFNPIAQDFLVRGTPAQFLFAAEDGTISTWASINGNSPAFALLARDDSISGAVYAGLAILTPRVAASIWRLPSSTPGLSLLMTPASICWLPRAFSKIKISR